MADYMEHMGVWMGNDEAGIGVGRKGKRGKVRVLYVTNANIIRQVGTIDEESVDSFVAALEVLVHPEDEPAEPRAFGR